MDIIFQQKRVAILSICLVFLLYSGCAQEVGEVEWKKVIVKEWGVGGFLNTNGGGLSFQQGRTPTYFNKHFWEIDLWYNVHHKTVRARNPYYSDATGYSYGKLCDLMFVRGGYGFQRTLHQKPYWGGVRIRYTISGGLSLGFSMPVYLYIVNYAGTGAVIGKYTAKYDPEKFGIDDILGRSSYFQGIGETKLHPGFYCKTGVNFDFSKNEYTMHAIEIGASIDMVFPFVQQMAYNKAKPFHLCAYIAYYFGKRKGNYE